MINQGCVADEFLEVCFGGPGAQKNSNGSSDTPFSETRQIKNQTTSSQKTTINQHRGNVDKLKLLVMPLLVLKLGCLYLAPSTVDYNSLGSLSLGSLRQIAPYTYTFYSSFLQIGFPT